MTSSGAVEESRWSPPEKPEIIELRVEFEETELQRRVKLAGGKCNSAKRVWEIHYGQAVALGLKKRIKADYYRRLVGIQSRTMQSPNCDCYPVAGRVICLISKSCYLHTLRISNWL
jgi:hypothetical protein